MVSNVNLRPYAAYIVDYLHVQKGLSVQQGTVAVTVFGIGAVIGTIVGGVVGQWIYNRCKGRASATRRLIGRHCIYKLNVHSALVTIQWHCVLDMYGYTILCG